MPDEATKANFAFPADFLSRLIDLTSKEKWINQKRKQIEELFQQCGNANEASVIMHTLEVFEYLDGDRLAQALQDIADKILKVWCLPASDTRIVCKDIEGRTDSSAALQQMIKPLFAYQNGWSSNKNFPSQIEKVIEDKEIKNIVLVDDFSGTGRSLSKLCNWISDKCVELDREHVNIYACFVSAMDATSSRKYNENLKEIHFFLKSRKAISTHFPNDGKNEKTHMTNFEINYGNITKSYSLGYDKSEAVFHVQNMNTPNNVLPIFWQKGKTINPIFPRLGKNNGK